MFLQVPLAVPLRMFEVFTAVNSAASSLSPEEAMSAVAKTLLYVVKRGQLHKI